MRYVYWRWDGRRFTQKLCENTSRSISTPFPLTHLFSAVAIDERGRVTAKRPSLLTSDIDEREAGIRAEMFHQAQIEWQVAAQAFINPARLQIIREHHTSPSDLAFLVQTNPFVPSGREAMFARGIHAGLIGDFLLSAHLLVPQVENSLRYVLALNGVVTSKLDSRLIQEERVPSARTIVVYSDVWLELEIKGCRIKTNDLWNAALAMRAPTALVFPASALIRLG